MYSANDCLLYSAGKQSSGCYWSDYWNECFINVPRLGHKSYVCENWIGVTWLQVPMDDRYIYVNDCSMVGSATSATLLNFNMDSNQNYKVP